jgi:hypothetical protein
MRQLRQQIGLKCSVESKDTVVLKLFKDAVGRVRDLLVCPDYPINLNREPGEVLL